MCACSVLPPLTPSKASVSADYDVVGDVSGMRAFIYGKRTVLEFPRHPLRLTIQDENGVAVSYEREGHYYRLSRKLDHFTVWANTRVLSFSPATAQKITLADEVSLPPNPPPPAEPVEAAAPIESSVPLASEPISDDAAALMRLSIAQLDEVRRLITVGAGDSAASKALNARLDRIEARLTSSAVVMVRVHFDLGKTDFIANDQLVRILIPAAKAAQHVNLRGRTDARIAGRDDPRIALGRALATRRFLVERGVEANKIRVFALPAGDFLAPGVSDAGRALNRRVEIELVNRRNAKLNQQEKQQPGVGS